MKHNSPALVAYAKGVRKLASTYRGAIAARIELAKLRAKAQKALEAMSDEERFAWESEYLAKPIAKLYGSVPYPSNRGTITFRKQDGSQCTQSISAFSDLKLSPEELEKKIDDHKDTVNTNQKKARASAKAKAQSEEEEDAVIEIVAKPKISQLKAIVELCSKSQLLKLIELANAKLADE